MPDEIPSDRKLEWLATLKPDLGGGDKAEEFIRRAIERIERERQTEPGDACITGEREASDLLQKFADSLSPAIDAIVKLLGTRGEKEGETGNFLQGQALEERMHLLYVQKKGQVLPMELSTLASCLREYRSAAALAQRTFNPSGPKPEPGRYEFVYFLVETWHGIYGTLPKHSPSSKFHGIAKALAEDAGFKKITDLRGDILRANRALESSEQSINLEGATITVREGEVVIARDGETLATIPSKPRPKMD